MPWAVSPENWPFFQERAWLVGTWSHRPQAPTRQTQDTDMPQETIHEILVLSSDTQANTLVSLSNGKKCPAVMDFLKSVIYIRKTRNGHVRTS